MAGGRPGRLMEESRMPHTISDPNSIASCQMGHFSDLRADREVEFAPGLQATSKDPYFPDASGFEGQGSARGSQLTSGRGIENDL